MFSMSRSTSCIVMVPHQHDMLHIMWLSWPHGVLCRVSSLPYSVRCHSDTLFKDPDNCLDLRNVRHVLSKLTACLSPCKCSSCSRVYKDLQRCEGGGAGMSVDLQAQPSFSLDLPKENWSPDEYEDCPLVRLGRRGSAGSSRSSRRNKYASQVIPA